jgi:hypothetical protein
MKGIMDARTSYSLVLTVAVTLIVGRAIAQRKEMVSRGLSKACVTRGWIPGAFSFTGMKVTHSDGSPFAGIGIVPDIVVPLRAVDFATGRDPELAAAIQAFK